eukprot:TRINITY_DN50957_c0_g1_i1.p1 TRINITY_DN50957_c0_g1~~TRINITY_DN50957_c0_g1_i1.p1  ORF type:complete len:547 (+),score=111.60 TRINITY_DN50957_c0_g1_i1:59-1699(+)
MADERVAERLAEAPYQQMIDGGSTCASLPDCDLNKSFMDAEGLEAAPSGWCAGPEGLCTCCSRALRCCLADPLQWLCFAVRCALPSLPQCCVLGFDVNGSNRLRALEVLMQKLAASSPRRLRALQSATHLVEAVPLLRAMHLYMSGAGVKHRDVDERVLPCGGEWLWPEEHGDFAAARSRGKLVLYIHGGAFVLCNPATHRSFTRNMMHAADSLVLVAKYRQPPQHPFPAALDDVVSTYRRVLLSGYFKPSQIIVAGESAGGNLSLALCMKLRPEEMPGGVVLISPWVDLAESPADLAERWKGSKDYLVPELVSLFASSYVCGEPVERCLAADEFSEPSDPQLLDAQLRLASPLHDKGIDDLPPALLIFGSSEMLASQNRKLWERMLQSGNRRHEIFEAEGMVHGFPMFADVAYGGVGHKIVRVVMLATASVLLFLLSGLTSLFAHKDWDLLGALGAALVVVGVGVAAALSVKPEWLMESAFLRPDARCSSFSKLEIRRPSQDVVVANTVRVKGIKEGEDEQPAPYEAYRRISLFARKIWDGVDLA